MNIEENRNTPWMYDTKKLLDELLDDISREYGIDKSTAERLIQSKSINDLNSLKNELDNIDNTQKDIKKEKLEKLYFTIIWAKEVIEKASKDKLDLIKKELENQVEIEEFKNTLDDYLPKSIINAAKNPQNIHEHIIWASLWTANSIIKTVEILYQIWAWILKTPYHIYLILSWKWEYDGFKRI